MLEELLDDVVSKHVGHQLYRIGLNLPEHLVLFIAVGRLELLLYETRPMLIAAEFNNVIVYVLYLVSMGPGRRGEGRTDGPLP